MVLAGAAIALAMALAAELQIRRRPSMTGR